MAFINNQKLVIPHVFGVKALSHGHYICFQIILIYIALPHLHKICRTKNQCTTSMLHFINLCNSTCRNRFSQSYNIPNHRSTTFLKVTGRYLDRSLLEVKKLFFELLWKIVFTDTCPRLLTQVVRSLQINIIGKHFFTGPTFHKDLSQLIRYVYTEFLVPLVLKPIGKNLSIGAVCNLSIKFPLSLKPGKGQVA